MSPIPTFRHTWRDVLREVVALFRQSFWHGSNARLMPFEPYPSHFRPPMKKANV